MRKILFTAVIVIAVAVAFLAGNRYGRDQSVGAAGETERRILYYTDPMNPGFRSEKPGTAPCGMPLEPVYAEVGANGEQVVTSGGPLQSPGAVKINQARQQLIGVRSAPAEKSPMTYNLRLYGKVVPDDTRIYNLNSSTDSWVRTLSDAAAGSIVKKDQILAEILDPDFYTAQVTYLVSLSNVERYQNQLGGNTRMIRKVDLADNQMRVALQDILDYGVPDAQIEELARTRKAQPLLQVRSPVDGVVLDRDLSLYQWIKAGEEFYRIADLGRVWVYADVYEDEVMYLEPGMDVQVKQTEMDKTFKATVSQVMPIFDQLTRTRKVRLDVDNPGYDLWPDMFVDVEIPITMKPSLHVPTDAVIDSGTQKTVYVDVGDSTFEPRPVETGWRLGRQVEIIGGLMPREKVIISGNFLIDSESRMKTAAGSIVPTMRKDPVCGMYVNEEYAKLTDKTVKYGDKTYYFCMDKCRDEFVKEPGKYAKSEEAKAVPEATDAGHEHHATMKMDDKSWLDKIESARHSQGDGNSGSLFGKQSSWADFMSSRYYGLEDNEEKAAEQHNSMPDSDSDKSSEEEADSKAASATHSNAGHPDMQHDMPSQATPDNPVQPAE